MVAAAFSGLLLRLLPLKSITRNPGFHDAMFHCEIERLPLHKGLILANESVLRTIPDDTQKDDGESLTDSANVGGHRTDGSEGRQVSAHGRA